MAPRNEIELRPADELAPEEFAIIEAQEFFVVQAQHTINRLMRENRVSQAELARRLNVSEARVSAMFSSDKNFTLRTIAKILHAIGEEPMLTTSREANERSVAADYETQGWQISSDLDSLGPTSAGSNIDLKAWSRSDMAGARYPGRLNLNS